MMVANTNVRSRLIISDNGGPSESSDPLWKRNTRAWLRIWS